MTNPTAFSLVEAISNMAILQFQMSLSTFIVFPIKEVIPLHNTVTRNVSVLLMDAHNKY